MKLKYIRKVVQFGPLMDNTDRWGERRFWMAFRQGSSWYLGFLMSSSAIEVDFFYWSFELGGL